MIHPPVIMRFVDRYPVKSRPSAHFKLGKNVWFSHYKCDSCGLLIKRLTNLHIKSQPICYGTGKQPRGEQSKVQP